MAPKDKKKEKKASGSEETTARREYSFDIVETGENLYIYKQKTYEEISKITGVPVVTIQRWSEKYEWRNKKLEQVKQRVSYRRDLYMLRDAMLKKAMDSTDPQAIHALANLQRVIDAEEKMKPMEELPADIEKATGLSEETLSRIKEEIYGIRAAKKE